MCLTETPSKPFQSVVVDTVGPMQITAKGNKYIVTIMCDLTKYLIAVPVANKEANTVARAIVNNLFLTFGPFCEIKTDQGTEYNNAVLTELFNILQTKHFTSTAYRPQSIGTIERNHRVLNEYFRHYMNALE